MQYINTWILKTASVPVVWSGSSPTLWRVYVCCLQSKPLSVSWRMREYPLSEEYVSTCCLKQISTCCLNNVHVSVPVVWGVYQYLLPEANQHLLSEERTCVIYLLSEEYISTYCLTCCLKKVHVSFTCCLRSISVPVAWRINQCITSYLKSPSLPLTQRVHSYPLSEECISISYLKSASVPVVWRVPQYLMSEENITTPYMKSTSVPITWRGHQFLLSEQCLSTSCLKSVSLPYTRRVHQYPSPKECIRTCYLNSASVPVVWRVRVCPQWGHRCASSALSAGSPPSSAPWSATRQHGQQSTAQFYPSSHAAWLSAPGMDSGSTGWGLWWCELLEYRTLAG